MGTKLTLDEIRAKADAKYGSLDIPLSNGKEVSLLNVLRLSAANRAKVKQLQENLEADGADEEAVMRDLIETLAGSPTAARPLLTEVGKDLALMMTILDEYGETASMGEASASQS